MKHPEWLFDHFHKKIHHAFVVFGLAIIGMLWGTSNILTHTVASWQWGGFLTPDFWDQNPSNANIMYAFFGDGTAGSTAYTKLWDSSCVPTNVLTLPTNFAGGITSANTIYILNAGTYTLTSPIIMDNCSVIVGKGNVYIKPNSNSIVAPIDISNKNRVIVDNIKIDGQNISPRWIYLDSWHNINLNTINVYNSSTMGIYWTNQSSNVSLNNSKLFNNLDGWYFDMSSININNSHFFNNNRWLVVNNTTASINNSQFNNNANGITATTSPLLVNNSIFLNNTVGLYGQSITGIFNTLSFYNNTLWLHLEYSLSLDASWFVDYYGNLNLFNNTTNYLLSWVTLQPWSAPLWSRSIGQMVTWFLTIDYDRFTNPQNGSGQRLLNGTNRTWLIGQQPFDVTKKPIRYIFWGNILKQTIPAWYHDTTLEEYGTNWADYLSTKYITESESSLSPAHQLIVNQYFGSESIFVQNRQTNGCSLSAFQVKTLAPNTFTSSYVFEDHTIYILTGGEYSTAVGWNSNGFIFNGNCIALIWTTDTRFTKSGWGGMNSILYANNKRNIIIDNIKVDGLYFSIASTSTPAQTAIKFDGITNNSTINAVQAYNTSYYGIYLGLNSHHNTIMNSQFFNNMAGIHLYYSSNYNVINNTQAYNNTTYGIWFANGSQRNTINNIQVYNNTVWVFGDLTTKENVINRAAIYNNSDAGIYLKNSSSNMLNDVRLYNNGVGIRTIYSSIGNKYYGELKFFDNWGGNFDWTLGNDTYLSAGTAGLFPYAGVLSTWSNIVSCLYATNPILSWNSLALLTSTCNNTWYVYGFTSEYNSYVNYAFGLNMYKQKVPVRYSSWNSLIQIPSQYNSGKYIAEISAIRDTTPEGVNFVSSGSTELNTWYTTNTYTAGILNIAVPVVVTFNPLTTSGYLVLSGNVFGLTWIVNNGDTLQIHVLTRTWYKETITWTITLWSVTTWFTITTRGLIQTPTTWSLSFSNLTNVPLHIFTWSTTTIAWLETGVFASISFLPSDTSWRLEIYSGAVYVHSWTTGLLVYNGNTVKAIAQSSTWYTQMITGMVRIGLGTGLFTITTKGSDSTPPTTPTIIYPLSWEKAFFITFEWLISSDTGSWLGWYLYEIAEDSGFVHIINTGFITTTTWTIGSPNSGFNKTSTTYYYRIKAKDKDGNYSLRSNTGYFTAIRFTNWDFTNQNDANLRTYYDSDEIILTGIKTGLSILATLDGNGTIYKNGSDSGTGTLVQNGDTIYITVRSSNLYDTTVSSVLTIANRTLSFDVTTKQEWDNWCTLSDDDTSTIQTIFDSLVDNYSGDANKFDEFLYTMQSMLADEIDFTNDCNLQYLEDLINAELGTNVTWDIDTSAHIAPNCKEYMIVFDSTKMGYTSPSFKSVTYFANRDALGRYIDSQNPGDCHTNTYEDASWIFTNTDLSRHIASNGKLYTIQYTSQWYTANEFIVKKYFANISALRNYIDSKNTPQAIRSHEVDTSFTPQTYIAPNGKSYTIYRTDRWYMSYKLIKVKYFFTLTDIQSFIAKNNPK